MSLNEEEKKLELNKKRHSMSHVLASAIKQLYPNVKLGIGPAIDNGFYYDFDCEQSFSPEDFSKIEAKMQEIINSNQDFEKQAISKKEALELFKNEPYKLELINDLPESSEITTFKNGDFVDLCKGPHVENTKYLRSFAYKINRVSGAYWRGSEKNKMLQRIYVYGFDNKNELKDYIKQIEEALKRDHNKIGRELNYFTTSEYVGQGLPCLMPKGAKLFQILNRYVQDKEENEYGYVMTKTPLMAKSDLYKISGHWDHYKEGMFVLGDEEKDKEVFALRPMTCPFQYQVYLANKHSYRDLPIRYGETSTLFRNEDSGEMHGLIRVRQFTISEGHLILRPDQLEEEFKNCIKLLKEVMTDIGLINKLSYRLSKWDPNDKNKYIGTQEMWDESENLMRTILDHLEIPYTEAVGEAAFYGPKLDIQIKNVHGKEDTLVTVQIDLMLARQFEMTYTDADGKEKYPYIIHRTSLGCYERTIALLLEHYAGALPTWLSPTQVKVLNIAESNLDYAKLVTSKLKSNGIRVELDDRSESIGKKIREAQLDKVPYMLIVGDKEKEDGTVAVRGRKTGDLGVKPLDEFIAMIEHEVKTKKLD